MKFLVKSLFLGSLLGFLGFLDFLRFGCLNLRVLSLLADLFFFLVLLLLLGFLGLLGFLFVSLGIGNSTILQSSFVLSGLLVISIEKSFLFEFTEDSIHGVLVLAGLGTVCNKLQTLLDLALEGLTNFRCWVLREAINTGGDSTLVSQITGDFTLVGSSGSSDKGRVEEKTILGSLSLGLEGTE